MLYQIDAADAEDGYKSMWLKNSADKVIEADLRYMKHSMVLHPEIVPFLCLMSDKGRDVLHP